VFGLGVTFWTHLLDYDDINHNPSKTDVRQPNISKKHVLGLDVVTTTILENARWTDYD